MNLKLLLYIPIIFFFLPAYAIFLGENTYFPVLMFIVPVFLFLIFILNYKKTTKYLAFAFENTPLKQFVYMYAAFIISGINAIFCGYYSINRFLYAVVFGYPFRSLFLYLYPIMVIPRFISIKKITKLFLITFLIIYLIGIAEFFGITYSITPINSFIHFISNIRPEEVSVTISDLNNTARIRSVFYEPANFGAGIAYFLPIIYQLCLSKYRIYKNIYLNLLIKYSLIPLSWICLIMTQSPIYLIIALIVTLLFFYKHLLSYFIKYFKIIVFILSFISIFLLILFFVSNIDISGTYLVRITKVLSILTNFSIEKLIEVESSLATRVINCLNLFYIFLKHPIFGIGLTNNGHIVISQFLNSPVPLTQEITMKLAIATTAIRFNSNAMYILLYQTGIVGFSLYCLYMIMTIIQLKKVQEIFNGIEKLFAVSVRKTIITIFCVSIFYYEGFPSEILLFYSAIGCSVIFEAKRRSRVLKQKIQNSIEKGEEK